MAELLNQIIPDVVARSDQLWRAFWETIQMVGISGAISLVLALMAGRAPLTPGPILLVAALRSVGGAFHAPCLQAVTPLIAPPEALTRCAGVFCDMVQAEGYRPMIYFNQDLGYLSYNLSALKQYPFWLAQYSNAPTFYYDFDLWQYSHTGQVAGIEGNVDLDLDLR